MGTHTLLSFLLTSLTVEIYTVVSMKVIVSLMLQVKQQLAGKSAPGLMEFNVTTFENAGTSHVGLLRSFIGRESRDCVGL
jgi:hypothetical protein